MSQALIDLNISYEEFKTIVNEKEKYEQMKETIKNKNELSENSRNIKKTVEMHRFKKSSFLFCVFKMVDISVEIFAKNYIHAISQLKRGRKSI